MNPTIEALRQRRSVRAYEDRPVPAEVKQTILRSALEAPTAGNMTLYTILDITDPELKEKLSVTCDNQPFIAKAPIVLIFCADYYRWHQVFCRHVEQVRAPDAGDLLLANCDALIAAQNAVVAAESLGLGSCYIGDVIENFEIHQKLLDLPDYVVPTCMLCLGYPTAQQTARPKPVRFRTEDIVFENTYRPEKAEDMEQMLLSRENAKTPEELSDWIRRFCARKWNSDFSVEMSRSAREMLRTWCKNICPSIENTPFHE